MNVEDDRSEFDVGRGRGGEGGEEVELSELILNLLLTEPDPPLLRRHF